MTSRHPCASLAPRTWRSVGLVAFAATAAAVAPAARLDAQLPYDRTTFLHGIGSDSTIWSAPYPLLGGQTAPQYLSRQVNLKTVGAPRLNRGAPNELYGLRYAGQRDNLVGFLGGAGGQHVLAAHSLGSLVGRGAFQQVGAGRVTGILTMAAPHRGALIADSAVFAGRYVRDMEGAVREVRNALRVRGDFFQILGTVTLSPLFLFIGNQAVQNAKSNPQFPTEAIDILTNLEALKDLGPNDSAVVALKAYRGDDVVPRANIRGSIPEGHALLRVAAGVGAGSFEELKRTKDQGVSALRKCRNAGVFSFGLLAPAFRCQRALEFLLGLDERWAAYANGTERGFKYYAGNQPVYGQVPRKVPFDGVVPNENSAYPTSNDLAFDATVPGASHTDIYKQPRGLDAAAEGMLRMGMREANTAPAAWQFGAGDWDGDGRADLFAMVQGSTGSGTPEAHVLSGGSTFQQWATHASTPLGNSGPEWAFLSADWDGDRRADLIGVRRTGTGTHSTEVHILSAASTFHQFVLETGTPLEETGPEWAFAAADWDGDGRADLLAVNKAHTGSGSTEVHVLSGSSNFQQWAVHAATPLPETGPEWDFTAADWDGDGRADLFAIARAQTGSHSTEVHLLSGASSFHQWILHVGTPLHETPPAGASPAAMLVAAGNQERRPARVAAPNDAMRSRTTPGGALRRGP